MKRFLTGIDHLNKWMASIAGIMLSVALFLILLEIFLWNVFETTTLIADEYSAYILAIIVFWGAGYTLKEEGHIRITLFLNIIPQKLSMFIELIATTFTTGLMGYLTYYLFRMISSTYHYGSTSGTLSNTLLWIPQAIMLVGSIGFFLQLLASTIRSAQRITLDQTTPSVD